MLTFNFRHTVLCNIFKYTGTAELEAKRHSYGAGDPLNIRFPETERICFLSLQMLQPIHSCLFQLVFSQLGRVTFCRLSWVLEQNYVERSISQTLASAPVVETLTDVKEQFCSLLYILSAVHLGKTHFLLVTRIIAMKFVCLYNFLKGDLSVL